MGNKLSDVRAKMKSCYHNSTITVGNANTWNDVIKINENPGSRESNIVCGDSATSKDERLKMQKILTLLWKETMVMKSNL